MSYASDAGQASIGNTMPGLISKQHLNKSRLEGEGDIRATLGRLRSLVSDTEGFLSQLNDKLSPALAIEEQVPSSRTGGLAVAPEYASPIGGELAALALQVEISNCRIADMLRRIQL
jgi:hypothetical protein